MRVLVMCGVLAMACPPAWAVVDAELTKVAIVIRTIERFAADCKRQGGFKPADAATLQRWQHRQDVVAARARLPQIDAEPARRREVDQAVETIVRRIAAKSPDACAAALASARTPEAQFATATATAAAAAPAPPPAPPPAPLASVDPAVLARIEGFAFDSRAAMGIGGFLTTEIFPVVLFRDGQLLRDVEGLLAPGGIDAHRRAHPQEWSRWRRAGRELQAEDDKGWSKLPFDTFYTTLPNGFKLDGLYRRLGGGGNVAVGGTASVAVWNEFRFESDGRVSQGGGAGGRTEAGNTSVVTRHAAAGRQGRYRVEGLMLRIRWDDGSEESHVLIADPKDPTGVIWIDGQGHVQRRG